MGVALAVIVGVGGLLIIAGWPGGAPDSTATASDVAIVPATTTDAPRGTTRSPTPGAAGTASAPASQQPGTPAPTPEPVVLLGAGDIARCDGTADEATADLLAARSGIVFTLGDSVYPSGSAAQLRDCYDPSWGRVLDRTRFVVAGNHDYLTGGASPFRAYFGRAAVRGGHTWFSEDVGAWHVIVLDADCSEVGGCGPGSPELRWLHRDLARSTAACTLAMWHQPRFSSGYHGNDREVSAFWDELYSAGAELVLNGHDHDYERFAAQDPAGRADPDRGIIEIVAGTGGGQLRPFAGRQPNSVARSARSYGVVALTLRADGWDLEFVSTNGRFSDAATGTCHEGIISQ
jgi:3',5'-cyclic AMP phosphodiesterase CpdA